MKSGLWYTIDMNRTNVFVGPEDRAAIEIIQQRDGVATESDALRLALRVLAASPMLRSSCPHAPNTLIARPRSRAAQPILDGRRKYRPEQTA